MFSNLNPNPLPQQLKDSSFAKRVQKKTRDTFFIYE